MSTGKLSDLIDIALSMSAPKPRTYAQTSLTLDAPPKVAALLKSMPGLVANLEAQNLLAEKYGFSFQFDPTNDEYVELPDGTVMFFGFQASFPAHWTQERVRETLADFERKSGTPLQDITFVPQA